MVQKNISQKNKRRVKVNNFSEKGCYQGAFYLDLI